MKPKPRDPPPSKYGFELALRADGRINVTVRALRLMAALSEKNGFASMSVKKMARELKAKPAAVRQARQKLVELRYFTKPKSWKYHRVKQDGDDKRKFWDRIQKDPKLDLAARTAFLLSDLTSKDGSVQISYAELGEKLDTEHAARAVQKLLEKTETDHFRRDGGTSGARSTYIRTWDTYQHQEDEDDRQSDQQDDDPFAEFARRGAGAERRRARAAAK